MADITLKGNPVRTSGTLPAKGTTIPDFTLAKTDLSDVTLADFPGKKVLNIFASLDTGICASSVKAFNAKAGGMDGVTVLNISEDLPFAHKRFCGAEGIESAENLSTFRSSFKADYGVEILDSGMKGLCARAVIVVDGDNKVLYAEQVPEIAQEPDYDAAIAALG